jgi:hypothetical protein
VPKAASASATTLPLTLPPSVTTARIKPIADGFEHPAHGTERNGDKDHVGTDNGLARILRQGVDDIELARPLQVGERTTTADDVADRPRGTQRTRQGSTDQSNPDDGKSFDHGARMSSSAEIKRAFSSSRPMLIRR